MSESAQWVLAVLFIGGVAFLIFFAVLVTNTKLGDYSSKCIAAGGQPYKGHCFQPVDFEGSR